MARVARAVTKADWPRPPTKEDFAALLEESFYPSALEEGNVVKGRVIRIEKEYAIIDVGLKTEGKIPLKEFGLPGQPNKIAVGDQVEVFLDRVENAMGEAILSRDKARREESWTKLEQAFEDKQRVIGVIFGRVKGGFTVDLDGAVAFLPGSQFDIRPVRDAAPLMNRQQTFLILKMDKRRGNIVVSRRAVLEESRAEQRNELVANLKEGQVIDGVVKNITDYGAFVDLGGVDGLLHVTDIAWRRVNHPSEVLSIGANVKVQVIKVNPETQRISLGMKQLEADPWEGVASKYPVQAKFKGRVTNITDYGAFVELEPGVEGLVHVSEMSWVKKNVHPGKIISTSQEVEVMVLEVDSAKRRISLGLKQTMDNPWHSFSDKHPVGSQIEGEIKNITEFGLFIGLDGDIDGMAHLSDLDWNEPGEEAIKKFKKGDRVKAIVLDIDTDKERIALGVKQVSGDPMESLGPVKKGDIVTCTVTEVTDGGLEVSVGELKAFIRKNELSRERSEQRPERYSVGDKVDARVTNVDKAARKITLSIKAREIAEEKEAVAQYGSSDFGASLGDILGAALRNGSSATSPLQQFVNHAVRDSQPNQQARNRPLRGSEIDGVMLRKPPSTDLEPSRAVVEAHYRALARAVEAVDIRLWKEAGDEEVIAACSVAKQLLNNQIDPSGIFVSALSYNRAAQRAGSSDLGLGALFVADALLAELDAKALQAALKKNIGDAFAALGDAQSARAYALASLELSIDSQAYSVGVEAVRAFESSMVHTL